MFNLFTYAVNLIKPQSDNKYWLKRDQLNLLYFQNLYN